MIYLNEKDLLNIGVEWDALVGEIKKAVECLDKKDFSQPIKPYLRYRNLKNRIISMPAFVGGEIDMAGIKWIASFPDNIYENIPRAHSVVILNEANTGIPVGIVNTATLSMIRTASVSGLMIKKYMEVRDKSKIKLGIIGWGPIGQHHLKMCASILGDKIESVRLFDKRPIIRKEDITWMEQEKIEIVDSWQEAYKDADIFMTCTVSDMPYIDLPPKQGSLQLNVSLRDYKDEYVKYVRNAIIVDDWEEVCREKTDIEMMNRYQGLKEEECYTIQQAVCHNIMEDIEPNQAIMFNPMGMSVFDITIGAYYLRQAQKMGIGTSLL